MKTRTIAMGRALCLSLIVLGACNTPTDPKTPEYWIYRLDDKKENEEAVKKLGEMKDAKAVEPLLKVLKEDDKLRPAAAQSLGMIGDPRAIQPLIAAITLEPGMIADDATRAKNATNEKAINALGDLKAKEAVDIILQMQKKARDMPVRMACVRAMGAIRDPKFGPAMLEILQQDDNMFTKKTAAEVLGDLHDAAAVPDLIAAMYLEKAGASVYPQASFALYQIGEPAVMPLVETLEGKNERVMKLAKEKNFVEGAVEVKAIEVLGDLKAKQAEAAMLKAWDIKSEDVRPYIRRGVALAFGAIGGPKAVPHLIKALDEPSGELRSFYVEALNELSDRSALPALLNASKKGTEIGKKSAFVAYTRLGDGRDLAAAEAVAKTMPEMQPELVRLQAAKECGEKVDCWIGKLKDKDARVRDRAAYALGRAGDKKAADAIVAVLKDPNLETRYAYIWALGRVGTKAQVSQLKAIAAAEKGLPTHRGNDYLKKLIVALDR
jgi:HEAT repeat protein